MKQHLHVSLSTSVLTTNAPPYCLEMVSIENVEAAVP